MTNTMKKITSLLTIGALSVGIQSASANLIFDGKFEHLSMTYYGPVYADATQSYTGDPVVGWQTTHTNNTMEIWGRFGVGGITPPAGSNYLAEMNAFEVSSLYQVITAPNTNPFDIFFQHRGRSGSDKAGVSLIGLGSATSWTRGSGTVLYQTVFTSPNSAWSTYSADNFFTPVSGSNYALVFDSITSAGGATQGNLLADVRLGDGVFDASASLLTPQSFTPSYGPAGGGGGGTAAVPEPGQVAASLLLLGGIGGYVFLKRRKAAKAAVPAVA